MSGDSVVTRRGERPLVELSSDLEAQAMDDRRACARVPDGVTALSTIRATCRERATTGAWWSPLSHGVADLRDRPGRARSLRAVRVIVTPGRGALDAQ
jgi:hypothetical protein